MVWFLKSKKIRLSHTSTDRDKNGVISVQYRVSCADISKRGSQDLVKSRPIKTSGNK